MYREYADSIIQLAHSKEIKEIQEKYAHEKLVNENNLLKIRNGNLMRTYLGISMVGLMITACVVFVYQRKLLNKERLLQKIKDELNMNLVKLRENEAAMKDNEEMIKKMSTPVNRNTGPENHADGIENLRQKNYSLLYQNEILEKKVQAYTGILQEKELKLASYEKLRKQDEEFSQREQFLMDQLEKHIDILGKLRDATKAVKPDEWPEIIDTINNLNNDFAQRLKQQAPFLSESDIQCCCLVRLHLSTAVIATLTAVSPASVTKRKQRIRSRISRQTPHLLEKTASLDDFILKF